MVMSHFGYKEAAPKECVNSMSLGNAKLSVLDSVLYQGIEHELATFKSNLRDNIDMLVLYEKIKRRGECIPNDSFLSLEAVHQGSQVRWLKSVSIKDYKIIVEYTKSKRKKRTLEKMQFDWE